MDKKLILVIDFNNILFGGYYGQVLKNSKGINVNAVKTFFFKLKMLKDTLNPHYIVMANDISRDLTFRRKLYKPYKANRKPHDPDIINQLKLGVQIAGLAGFPFINNELYEADDIIGMITTYAKEHDMDTIILSSDKDLYQLLHKGVYIMGKGNEVIGEDWLMHQYHLTPEQWIEKKMLEGDRGDNIPGIDGVGEVTALRLLHEYNDIETIYQHIHHLKPSLREQLLAGKSRLPLIRELVTIVTDYTKIGLELNMMEMKTRYVDELFEVLDELEIYSLFNVFKYSLLVDPLKPFPIQDNSKVA